MNGGAHGRGEEGDPAGEWAQRALPALFEEAFLRELSAEALEGEGEVPDPRALELPDDELVLSPRLVDRDRAARHDFDPAFRGERQGLSVLSEEDAAKLGRLVLEGEVDVSGAVPDEVGDLAADAHVLKGRVL